MADEIKEPTPPAEPEAPQPETPPPAGSSGSEPKAAPLRQSRSVDSAWATARRNEREAARLRTENDALKRQIAAGSAPLPPDPASFADPTTGVVDREKWQRSMTKWADDRDKWRGAQATSTGPATDGGSEPEADERLGEFQAKAAPLREQYKDFDAVVEQRIFTPALAGAILDSDLGPAVAYHLGKHPAEAARLGNLPPEQIYREIGRLEVRLSADRRSVSGAPEPIQPVGGRDAAVVKSLDDSTDMSEYMTRYRQQLAERRKHNPFAI